LRAFKHLLAMAVLAVAGLVVMPALTPPALAADQPMIIDHNCTNLGQVPAEWMERAKQNLRLSYGHTSHGSQIVSGMDVLTWTSNQYAYNWDGTDGALSLHDYVPDGDLGNPDRVTWASRTREMLNAGSDRNVVVWSWCGQVSWASPGDIDIYLNLMNQLERDYPHVTFVYMTGHLDGTGEGGNLNQRNNQIRDYCRANSKVLYDFADIESYDPDGNYFLNRGATDGCDYDGGNWADEWCSRNPGQCVDCDCAHSQGINCQQKGKAFWWMLARLAGWEGPDPQ
jgi:hypothetical protein